MSGAAPYYFVDTSVFMRTAQCHIPDLRYLCEASTRFLDTYATQCAVSDLVIREVAHQLSVNARDYRGAKEVKRRVTACFRLSVENHSKIVERLFAAYADGGAFGTWVGRNNDNDRLHAAVASAFRLPYLVTWDSEFAARQEWVSAVNAAHGLQRLRFTRPDNIDEWPT